MATGLEVDTQNLRDFASAVDALVSLITAPGFVDPNLVPDVNKKLPDMGQHVAEFTDAVGLFRVYDGLRRELIGDAGQPGGSLGTFVSELKTLATIAGQIADNYDRAQSEDQFSSSMLQQALASGGM